MEFFTQIKIKPFDKRISHSQQILSIGSCFAENIAQRLRSAKFHVTSSPTGILFNPESIADCIDALSQKRMIAEEELQQANGVWFDFDFHSSFSSPDRDTAVSTMQNTINQDIKLLIESLYNKCTDCLQQVISLDDAIAFAADYSANIREAFLHDMASSTDVIDATLALAATQIEQLEAAYNFDLSLAKLLEAAGESYRFFDYMNSANSKNIEYEAF